MHGIRNQAISVFLDFYSPRIKFKDITVWDVYLSICLSQKKLEYNLYLFGTYMWTSRREDEFSSFFRSSPVLKYPPVFSWLLHVPPVFSWLLHVHVPNVQFAPCAFRPRKQDAIWMTYLWYFESLHSAEVFYSHFKICFNNFIYPPWVDYFTLGWWLFEYLLASTVNFKIYIFKIN